MEENTRYRIFVAVALLMLLSFGIFIGFRSTKNNQAGTSSDIDATAVVKNQDEDYNNENEDMLNANNTKKYDIKVVYETFYSLCNETIRKEELVYDTTIKELEESIFSNKDNRDYEVIEESNEKLVLRKTLNRNCPNHYMVKIDNGSVVIYNIVDSTVNTVYKTIDTQLELIRPEMLEELNSGIKVDSEEELNYIIEDLES